MIPETVKVQGTRSTRLPPRLDLSSPIRTLELVATSTMWNVEYIYYDTGYAKMCILLQKVVPE